MIKVPAISVASMKTCPRSSRDEELARVEHMLGDLSGAPCWCFPVPPSCLAELLLRRFQSAIKEAGNIRALNALSDRHAVAPSPPTPVIDLSTAVLTSAFGEFASDPDSILCVESEFMLTDLQQSLRGSSCCCRIRRPCR
jgi:chemotaxis protein CheC